MPHSLCPADANDKAITKLLKMSMVPLTCQESQLSSKGGVRSESMEWLLDIKDKLPIWSRLNTINTSGYNRKLPMSMSKNYDIEIKGRLWSLWGQSRHKKLHRCKNTLTNKSYLAATILALCAAKVFRLNIWTSQLLDNIKTNAKTFLKESLKNLTGNNNEFQLEDLDRNCNLEGMHFKIFIETKLEGRLYSAPYQGHTNLAFALINFFQHYQFGILECCKRILGFGYDAGSEGGYFMFDAQSQNYPIFHKNSSAPYLLRTNHLQILLYCLVISVNTSYNQANFSIHNVKITIIKPELPKIKCYSSKRQFIKLKRILPQEHWKMPSVLSCPSNINIIDELAKTKQLLNDIIVKPSPEKLVSKQKYRRRFHNISKHEVKNAIIKPIVDPDLDSDESLKVCQSFVKIICSETVVPLTTAEEVLHKGSSFVRQLPDVFVTRL